MKNILTQIIMAASILVCGQACASVPVTKQINQGWKFKQARLTNWYPATVPGVVHTDLMANGIIEDPFYRLNERGLQWIDKEDWIYQTDFSLESDMAAKSNIELNFDGLDTYADVYLNDSLILKADNMFRRWSVSVKGIARSGENTLKVYFNSPVKVDLPKCDEYPFQYPASNDQSENGGLLDKRISVFARKAGYHYGWDWGPRLVTSGIWRPVYMKAWDGAKISDVFYEQRSVNAKRANVATHVELFADRDIENATVTVSDKSTAKVLKTVKCDLKKGLNNIVAEFSISNPRLWWSNGLGEAYRYDFQTKVETNGELADVKDTKVGLRSLKMISKPDKDGHVFYVELNGKPVFAKGANYIPCDNFLPRVTPDIYKKTVLDAVDVNMNMLRIWGGGTYEDDLFYDLCDEYGIMIWQDFMFACSMYPAEGALLENIRLEAVDNVKRLRNHACIALWCGNNECQDAWLTWGWKEVVDKVGTQYSDKIWKQYKQQYYVTLPDVVKEYAPETFYWPSSPHSMTGDISNDRDGDRHYWSVWHGKVPISDYNKEKSRFFSEYGFQSFPEFASVKRYAPKAEDWDIRSEVMMSHQRGGDHANGLIETYLLNEYKKPKDFEAFLYMNQLLQGDAIKTAIESHRRQKPYNMGTLFWQHNDCWPVASWASRDYYGRWKAQHYFSKYAFDDILVSPIMDGDNLYIYVVSDRLSAATGLLEIEVVGFDGKKIFDTASRIKMEENSSKSYFNSSISSLLKGHDKGGCYVYAKFTDSKGKVYQNNYFLGKQKEMDYPKVNLTTEVTPVENGYKVTVGADKFTRAVFVSVDDNESQYSDNYFDIEPNGTVTITIKTSLTLDDMKKGLKVRCLNNEF